MIAYKKEEGIKIPIEESSFTETSETTDKKVTGIVGRITEGGGVGGSRDFADKIMTEYMTRSGKKSGSNEGTSL